MAGSSVVSAVLYAQGRCITGMLGGSGHDSEGFSQQVMTRVAVARMNYLYMLMCAVRGTGRQRSSARSILLSYPILWFLSLQKFT